MVAAELDLLKEIIRDLKSGIDSKNQDSVYDVAAQADALYGSSVPEIKEAFETMKDQSGLVYRQASVISKLLQRYLSLSEASLNVTHDRPVTISHQEGGTVMTSTEYNQNVYRVMCVVLKIPDAPANDVATACGLSIEDLWCYLDYISKEGLLDGIRVQHGGQGSKPLMAVYDGVSRTRQGLEFMQQFEEEGIPHIEEAERPSVFISYNQKSGSSFVDYLEVKLKDCAIVKRDKSSVEDWGSFSTFMKSIRKQDFVVAVITEDYLHSQPCMFEVCELMKDDDWRSKVMFVILDERIYSADKFAFTQYWQEEERKLNERAESLEPNSMEELAKDLKQVSSIRNYLDAFIAAVLDTNNPKTWEVIDKIVARIRIDANTGFVEKLDNTAYAAAREEAIRKALE